jgi:hypothetical protein
VPPDAFASQLEPKLASLLANPNKREAVFKSMPTAELKDALRACLYLQQQSIASEQENAQIWAQRTIADVPARLLADLAHIIESILKSTQERRGIKAQGDHDFHVAAEKWRSEGMAIRETLHRLMEQATHTQWNLGPRFLVGMEDLCREQNLWARSIPWDPARMVGWKIMVRQVKLDTRDLQTAAREFALDTLTSPFGNEEQTGDVDGSYFTDYVHYIAISKPGVSTRNVTRDLVARLLRPAEMATLIQSHGGIVPEKADALLLADLLLGVFGWH